jgi:tetratricopeptide (TPR) repeat protein/SAM-dependent methyltransferase
MSRKQRRAAGPFGPGPTLGTAAGTAFPGTLADLFAAAVAQHQAGALADAERRYRYILTLFPDHADSLHNLGLLALHGGNAPSAAELIGKAIKLNNRVGEYHYNIALAWRALNRLDRVAAHLERAIELRRDHALAHLNLGNVRHEQGRLAEAIACYERALVLSPKSAGPHCNLANVLSGLGRWDAAIASYKQALALEPNFAEAHNRLGVALMTQGRSEEAVPHFEAAAALKPDLPGGYGDLASAYLSVGKLDSAVHAAARALELKETPQNKVLFAQCVKSVRFTAQNDRLRSLVLRALSEGWARPRELTGVCISIIKLNSVMNNWIARANSAWPARLGPAEMLGPSGLAALAQDRLLACFLECDPVTDIELERLLTNVRHAMLTVATRSDQAINEQHLKLFAAVARQCFLNEYVFALPHGEADRARDLQSLLAQAITDGAPVPPLWPIAVGAYFPLHTLPGADALLDRSWPDYVGALLLQQITEPAQERRLAATMPVLTAIDDEVSRAVRQQYEENPYPRWVKAGPPVQPAALKDSPQDQVADVLVTGCGTGLSTIEFARQMGNARILAIDLSLASLSYAKRMAENFGLTNIEFGQADLMMLGAIGRKFDFIDASGVLHHLADPWAGWKILLSLLRPGGVMQVGLYSELARQNIVAARALIAERGYRPSPEDIRRCRDYIIATKDPLLKSLVERGDFFTISECRDFLFHVQEHRVTLPQIKAFLAASGVQFTGFIPVPSIMRQFAARFPERSALHDLDCWHSFETEAPATFGAMYQFWVRNPAALPDTASKNSN